MIEVKKVWATSPIICDICEHKNQLVFECEIIRDSEKESWKLPDDVLCEKCGSDKITFPDFQTNPQ